jgi:hypothetical protein
MSKKIIKYILIIFLVGAGLYFGVHSLGKKGSDINSANISKQDNKEDYDLKSKEYKEKNKKSNTNFTLEKAIEFCKEKYGNDVDTVYIGNENIENVNGKTGYIVQVKSKELMKQGGTGVLFTVLVCENGEIIEIE